MAASRREPMIEHRGGYYHRDNLRLQLRLI